MANVTIRYGLTNSVTRSFDEGVTVHDVLADRSIRAALSAPEAVVAVSNGDTLLGDSLVENYDSITLEQQASSKA
jgi:sulfur carrier protein ThiS